MISCNGIGELLRFRERVGLTMRAFSDRLPSALTRIADVAVRVLRKMC